LIKAFKAFDLENVKFLTGGNGPAAYNLEQDDYIKHNTVIALNFVSNRIELDVLNL